MTGVNNRHADAMTLAEHIVEEYAADLIGGAGDRIQEVLDRLVLENEGFDRTQAIARMRGPYIQALQPPEWSDQTWPEFAASVQGQFAPLGFHLPIRDALTRRGVRRLYRFQEEGMQAVLEGRSALITAATGRGKTETWLMPLLQYIMNAKDGNVPNTDPRSTKALLLYPTKALAQDQLRRLIGYLIDINRDRARDQQITIGILTGDTPSSGDIGARDYLYKAFRLFECPIPPEKRCQSCTNSLIVDPKGEGRGRLTLRLPIPECEARTPLDFVVLTRDDMRREMPDIVITVPDILHLRLLNVNDEQWRRVLIDQPRYLVLDEVHTYASTFGASVTWIIRRLKAARAADGVIAPLRLIGASATVANGPELFARIGGGLDSSTAFVREIAGDRPVTKSHKQGMFPDVFGRDRWSERTAVEWFRDPEVAAALGGPVDDAGDDVALGELLIQRLFPQNGGELPDGLGFVQWCFDRLRGGSETLMEMRAHIAALNPSASTDAVDTALANALQVATTAGVLESRTHLFCWPVDGYYGCLDCGAVYLEPKGQCRCGGNFITRMVACRAGDELSAEGWLCPQCFAIDPLLALVDGVWAMDQQPMCERNHEPTPAIRAVWRPFVACPTCGTVGKQGDRCRSCDSDLTWPGGPSHSKTLGPDSQSMRLPWVCAGCGAVSPSNRPTTPCPSCGRSGVVLGGLVDVRVAERCSGCGKLTLPGRGCAGDVAARQSQVELKRFSLLDPSGHLLDPVQHRHSVPCYHRRARYELHRRYTSLARSPANVAVTSAQIALRRIASDPESGTRRAKMLSFSDSQNDMEQLTRDFNQPELDTFADQIILSLSESGAVPLAEVQRAAYDALPESARGKQNSPLVWGRRILRRLVKGRFGDAGSGTLTRQGLVNLRLTSIPTELDDRLLLAEVFEYEGAKISRLESDLNWSAQRVSESLRRLSDGSWVTRQSEYVWLEPTHLVIQSVGPGAPALRMPSGSFVLGALQQLGAGREGEPYCRRPEERIEIGDPDFSRAARRALSTPAPVLLRAATYKGSTSREERRQLEHAFSRKDSPNLLSSGPAMEVGIDIGDLDQILLYGTPPNINGYLQRIGRAGRRSKQSLVVSVSKRNPIDLYYYQEPRDLFESTAQPVPLQENNPYVVEAALTHAVLDYVAATWSIPWQHDPTTDRIQIVGEPYRRGTSRFSAKDRPASWLKLLWTPTEEVDDAVLAGLADLVRANRDDVAVYLQRLLNYGICCECGMPDEVTVGACSVAGCSGQLQSAWEVFQTKEMEAIDEFADRIAFAPASVLDRFSDERRRLKRESLELEEQEHDRSNPNRADAKRKRQAADAQLQALIQMEQVCGRQTLRENQNQSAYARFGYELRGGQDEVAVEFVRQDAGGETRERCARELMMALREFAPGAMVLQDGVEYITLALLTDRARTTQLERRLAALGQATPLVCMRCGVFSYDGSMHCQRCGGAFVTAEWMVPREALAYSRDEKLRDHPIIPGHSLVPSHAFPNGDRMNPVDSTFVNVSRRVLAFTPSRSVALSGIRGDGDMSLQFGDLEILSVADAISASYEDGEREPRARLFQLCGVPGCGGVIAPATQTGPGFCMIDPSHDASKSRVVQLAAQLHTKGIFISGLPVIPDCHSFAHGLRAGLEKVAGVLVRDVQELVTPEGVYLYDNEPGGAGITELLLTETGDWTNLRTALNVASRLAECECSDGCPRCLFQYGCFERNSPSSLSRRQLMALTSPEVRPIRLM